MKLTYEDIGIAHEAAQNAVDDCIRITIESIDDIGLNHILDPNDPDLDYLIEVSGYITQLIKYKKIANAFRSES